MVALASFPMNYSYSDLPLILHASYLRFFVGYAGVPLYNNNKIGLALIHINRKPGSADSVKEFVDVFLLQELAAGDSRWNSLMSRHNSFFSLQLLVM